MLNYSYIHILSTRKLKKNYYLCLFLFLYFFYHFLSWLHCFILCYYPLYNLFSIFQINHRHICATNRQYYMQFSVITSRFAPFYSSRPSLPLPNSKFSYISPNHLLLPSCSPWSIRTLRFQAQWPETSTFLNMLKDHPESFFKLIF